MTRRMPLAPLLSNRRPEYCRAAEIEVMRAREMGAASSPSAKARAACGAIDHGPGHDDLLGGRARPLHVGDDDAAVGARGDGLVHLGVAERHDVAVALQALLVEVHRQRHVDGDDELEVDGGLGERGAELQPSRHATNAVQRQKRSIFKDKAIMPATLAWDAPR